MDYAGVKQIFPERLNIVQDYPSHSSKYIVVRMVIEVDPAIIQETLDGEDTGKTLTIEQLAKVMEREMEQIKELKYGIRPKLPDWFKAVDCAEIEEVK